MFKTWPHSNQEMSVVLVRKTNKHTEETVTNKQLCLLCLYPTRCVFHVISSSGLGWQLNMSEGRCVATNIWNMRINYGHSLSSSSSTGTVTVCVVMILFGFNPQAKKKKKKTIFFNKTTFLSPQHAWGHLAGTERHPDGGRLSLGWRRKPCDLGIVGE